MKRHWFKKICDYFCFILFLFEMCRNPICLASEEGDEKDKQTSLIKMKGLVMSESAPSVWNKLETTEPGFEFSNEEMEKFKIWPRGIIPYYIDGMSFDQNLSSRIRLVLDVVNSLTGVKFTELFQPPEDDEERWVFFINRRGVLQCEDYNTNSFTNRGIQKVILGYDCLSHTSALGGTILAILGIPPQHNAPNRNDFIEVKEENILPDKVQYFDILKDDEWLFHNIDYDILSAGHYHFHQYTRNGSATIIPKASSDGSPIGEGDGLTYFDIWKIRMVYNYISKQRRAQTSDCSKLFKPGTEFQNYTPKSMGIEPRKKPEKYLALAKNEKQGEGNIKLLGRPRRTTKVNIANIHDYDTAEKK